MDLCWACWHATQDLLPPTGSWKFNNQEQLILEFEDAIRPPSASFALHFNYMLKEGLSGFYRSNYTGAPHVHIIASIWTAGQQLSGGAYSTAY